ncbi:MAG TPA: exodeoxyribonuclease VII large subunit [Acidobacteriota bacterium]|nr:exodeoxyribonuclease VII large subunit [Acidobacteriota bacterium]
MSQQGFRFQSGRRVLKVGDLLGDLRDRLESDYRDIWVQGEICDLAAPPSGHLYFALKDDDGRLRCACFRMQARYLKFRPENGMEVIARGSLSLYPPRGDVQLIVQFMEPLGDGARQAAFEQLKRRLQAEGLFDSERKRPLPLLPSKIGVVTSPSGAALRDILNVLKRRNDRLDVLIHPVPVQGSGAGRRIAAAVRRLAQRSDLDVIIVSRGGGSSEDLWEFNDEALARAIFACRTPVISAVGHEVDFTIADFVADLRAPTPSAAAEIVSGARDELQQRLSQIGRRLTHAVTLRIQRDRHRLQALAASRSFVDAESSLRYYLQRLDELQGRLRKSLPPRLPRLDQRRGQLTRSLNQALRYRLGWERQRLESRQQRLGSLPSLTRSARQDLRRAGQQLVRGMTQAAADQRNRLERARAQLSAFSPQAVLERGYAIVQRAEDEAVVRSPADASPGQLLRVRVAGGRFAAERIEDDEV